MNSSDAMLADLLTPGMRVAVADGVGAPTSVLGSLSRIAAERPRLRLLLGWCLSIPENFDPGRFAEVRTVMGGFALRWFVVHDCFSGVELIDYEDLGFCERGQAGKLIESGETKVGGRLPVNRSGDLKAKGHPMAACIWRAERVKLYRRCVRT